ncbi:hypothetical protein F5884DRAFT_744563 [Xylogone sp. PMI_703]|nr:hypothetical protein F5884DRAFT_744563 [Xylogone sp. PMI_703]
METVPAESFYLSTLSSVRVGPFAREAQVSYILGRVLKHVYEPTSDPDFDLNEAITLDRTLTSFRTLIPEEIDNCASYCGVIGICNSALLLLYDSTLSQRTAVAGFKGNNLDLLHLSAKLVVDIASNFENLIAIGKLKTGELSPLVLHSLYQAATIQAMLLRDTRDQCYADSYRSLINMLQGFNKRWKQAGANIATENYLKSLEQPL